MKAHVIAIGLALSLAATGAIASNWHSPEAPTKEEAMRRATADAEAYARRKGTCFKPAAAKTCREVAGVYSCRAYSTPDLRGCYAFTGWTQAPRRPMSLAQVSRLRGAGGTFGRGPVFYPIGQTGPAYTSSPFVTPPSFPNY